MMLGFGLGIAVKTGVEPGEFAKSCATIVPPWSRAERAASARPSAAFSAPGARQTIEASSTGSCQALKSCKVL